MMASATAPATARCARKRGVQRLGRGDHSGDQGDGDGEGELEGDVEAGDDLHAHQRAEADRQPPGVVARPQALHEQHQRRQHPGGPGVAQLVEVEDVGVAVGEEGVGQPDHHADRPVAGERDRERIGSTRRQHEGAEHEQIHGEDRVAGQQVERGREDRGRDVRVAISEGVGVGVEDVGVVEIEGIGHQRVLHPARDPDLQQRVAAPRGRTAHLRREGPGHHNGRDDERDGDARAPEEAFAPLGLVPARSRCRVFARCRRF
jgi:hypothetical protein